MECVVWDRIGEVWIKGKSVAPLKRIGVGAK